MFRNIHRKLIEGQRDWRYQMTETKMLKLEALLTGGHYSSP
jgi:hypothetical protein